MDHFDLIIIGTGSGNSLLTSDFDDWNVAIVERDVFGGTCLNRGCIPSKMFIYPSSIVEAVRTADRLGVDAQVNEVRWTEIVDRVFGRIDPIAAGGEEWRKSLDNITVFNADARIVGPKQVDVGDRVITADTIVLAAGARPRIPDIEGLDSVRYQTSATVMRLREVPRRMAVLGGGFIACEMAHVFGSAGAAVTIVNRSKMLLRAEDDDISERFTEVYRDRFTLRCGEAPNSIRQDESGEITLEFPTGDPLVVDELLVATGRIPNGEQLGVTHTGVALDDAGYVVVDEHGRTGVEGIWALGDISNPMQLKHTANAETRMIAHNIHHPDDLQTTHYSGTPSAVFADPQVASVGKTEQQLQAEGTEYITHTQPYAATAYGWAMEDEHGFCKVIADPNTRLLLGAHIIGHEASLLIQQLILGMRFDLTVDQMARGPLYPHPALSEVVEQALLEL
ncbi:MAG: mycothione reductase [Actinomycetota bacterium]